jgi:hypothetical protein
MKFSTKKCGLRTDVEATLTKLCVTKSNCVIYIYICGIQRQQQ